MGLPDADVMLYASQGRAANHAVDPQRLDATFGSGASTGLIRMSHPNSPSPPTETCWWAASRSPAWPAAWAARRSTPTTAACCAPA